MPRDKYGKAKKPGIAHKPDGFKSEDQSGSGKTPNAGKPTDNGKRGTGDTKKEPKQPYYGRKRN